jgi:hypothetical protein
MCFQCIFHCTMRHITFEYQKATHKLTIGDSQLLLVYFNVLCHMVYTNKTDSFVLTASRFLHFIENIINIET